MDTRTMLITGAAGGIGRATVNLFAQQGWRVIGVDRAPFGDGFPETGFFIQSDISIGENVRRFSPRRAASPTACMPWSITLPCRWPSPCWIPA